MQRNLWFAGLCTTLAGHALAAQECNGIRTGKAAAIAGTYVAAEAAVIAFRPADWWQGPVRSFQFNWAAPGRSPSANQDYLLHLTASYEASQAAALAWEWACASPMTAAWLGAATAFAVGLPKKIGDGFHDSGFETSKNLANAAGAFFPVMRQVWPATRSVNLKGWYWPSAEFRQRTPGGELHLLSDYAGQRYYLTFSPGLLPGGSGAWPRWLGAGVGHGTPAWATAPAIDDWYLTLDLNVRGLPITGRTWHAIASLIDQIHIPLPGLRLRNGTVTGGLY